MILFYYYYFWKTSYLFTKAAFNENYKYLKYYSKPLYSLTSLSQNAVIIVMAKAEISAAITYLLIFTFVSFQKKNTM